MFTPEQVQSIKENAHKFGVPIESAIAQAKEIQRNPNEYSPKQQAIYKKEQEEQKVRRDKDTEDARLEFEEKEAFDKRKKGLDKVHNKFTVVK